MDVEDEDDIYATNEGAAQAASGHSSDGNAPVNEVAGKHEDEEEGEEVEEDESDSVGSTGVVNFVQVLKFSD